MVARLTPSAHTQATTKLLTTSVQIATVTIAPARDSQPDERIRAFILTKKKPAGVLPAGFSISKPANAYAPMATRLNDSTVMPFDVLSSSWAMVTELSFTNSWFSKVLSL